MPTSLAQETGLALGAQAFCEAGVEGRGQWNRAGGVGCLLAAEVLLTICRALPKTDDKCAAARVEHDTRSHEQAKPDR